MSQLRLRPAAIVLATVAASSWAASSVATGDAVPWPWGRAPSTSELVAAVAEADELHARERLEAYLEAAERGEDQGHIQVFQEWIDEGRYDLDRIFLFGDALFDHSFRFDDGFGGFGERRGLSRVHDGQRGGRDTYSCAGCHSRGGLNGAGSFTQNALLLGDGDRSSSALARNAPHVLGVGPVQVLGAEMTRLLDDLRREALERAALEQRTVNVELVAKGVSFGRLAARPDGTLDTSEVEGVDADLVVRPFGWKGDTARLRRFVEDAARIHFGIQSHVLAIQHEVDPDPANMGNGPWYDPDGDGVQRELEEGLLTAGAVYLAMLEAPVVLPPNDPSLRLRWAEGSALFDEVGCSSCHLRQLPMTNPRWTELPDTTDGPGVVVNVRSDGESPKTGGMVELFSDLKRHDMGPELADAFEGPSGIPAAHFLTRPLWGLAETAPFLHDGRATTLHEAIRLHGGEAAPSRDAYLALSEHDQRSVHVFLLSLTRAPKMRVPR